MRTIWFLRERINFSWMRGGTRPLGTLSIKSVSKPEFNPKLTFLDYTAVLFCQDASLIPHLLILNLPSVFKDMSPLQNVFVSLRCPWFDKYSMIPRVFGYQPFLAATFSLNSRLSSHLSASRVVGKSAANYVFLCFDTPDQWHCQGMQFRVIEILE